MWQIRDQNGLIHSGTEEEMRKAWDCMTLSPEEIKEIYSVGIREARNLKKEWTSCKWEGDVYLAQFHAVFR